MKITKLEYNIEFDSKVLELLTLPEREIDAELKQKIVSRWENETDRLEAVLNDLLNDDPHWDLSLKCFKGRGAISPLESGGGKEEEFDYTKPFSLDPFSISKKTVYEYKRDLRGTYWEEIEISGKKVKSFSYSLLDYCSFENCKFNCLAGELSFKNCWFINCEFKNCWLFDLTLSNSVFIGCSFDNAQLSRLNNQKNILFLSCNFSNIDFMDFNLKEIYFDWSCNFKSIRLKGDIENKLSGIGKNVLSFIKSFESVEKKQIKKLRDNFNENYLGYSVFLKELARWSQRQNDHSELLIFNYYWHLYSDKAKTKKIISKNYLVYFVGRYIVGYGYHYWKPLIAYLLINFLFSFLFLFSGIVYRGEIINRSLSLSLDQFSNSLFDWFKCLYFSSITALTIGYGDSYPLAFLSNLLSVTLGFFEMILFTLFVVIFARRYFR